MTPHARRVGQLVELYSLLVVYAVWLGALAALYLPCRWFAGLKRRRSDAWLSYL